MAESSIVVAGDDVLASQYVNLRKDVLDAVLGHKHTGKTDEGATVGSPLFPKEEDFIGDGSDGDQTLSSALEISFPKQFNNVTLNSGGILRSPAGVHFLVIRIKGTLTINSGGILDMKGRGGAAGVGTDGSGNGNPGTDGFISELKSLPDEAESGGGGTTSPGTDGKASFAQIAAVTDAGDDLFMAFGAGGGSGSAQIAGKSGGNGGNVWAGGGGGGGGSAAGIGSGGGDGGGCLMILANIVVVNTGGIIRADGEDGGSSANSGGGGGGGLVYLATRSLTNNGTITANGGAGGVGVLSGGKGAKGLVVEKTIPG